jgi:uncharacterized protein
MQTKINWFQIPSTDLNRAVKFYETIFDSKLRLEQIGESPMGIFTAQDGDSIGCVVHGKQFVPNENGPVLYLDATPSIDAVLARVGKAGGRVLVEKTELPNNIGFVAHFIDTEGNRLALHAQA